MLVETGFGVEGQRSPRLPIEDWRSIGQAIEARPGDERTRASRRRYESYVTIPIVQALLATRGADGCRAVGVLEAGTARNGVAVGLPERDVAPDHLLHRLVEAVAVDRLVLIDQQCILHHSRPSPAPA